MSRRLAMLVAAAALSSRVQAQSPTMASAQVGAGSCTYATCALRLENGGFSGPRIRTGLDGAKQKVGFTGNAIVRAVESVPAALSEAQLGHSHQVKGRVIGLVTTSAAFAWVLIAAQSDRDATRLASIYGGVSLSTIGGIFAAAQMAKADQHFSRAIWQYNATLPR